MINTDDPQVFHLITRLLKGGAEEETIQTVLRLDDYDFTVGHGAEFDSDQRTRLEENGIETKKFESIQHYNPITAVPAVIAVARYLRREEFDIVHTHSTEAGIIGRVAAKIADVPAIIHTVHGTPFTEDRNELLNRFVLVLERLVAEFTDDIITVSDNITNEYQERGIGTDEQYRTIYGGIDVERFKSATPAQDLQGQRPRIILVGRLTKGKGVPVLLDAVSRLDVPFSVYVVGDGPLTETIQQEITERGLTKEVSLLGYRDDVPQLLKASDILVLPSYREGLPRVITEAMASGLPVIGTNVAGIPEQIDHGENGYLIPAGDAKELAERLRYLAENPDVRETFGERSRRRVSRFSVERMVNNYDEIYRQMTP